MSFLQAHDINYLMYSCGTMKGKPTCNPAVGTNSMIKTNYKEAKAKKYTVFSCSGNSCITNM